MEKSTQTTGPAPTTQPDPRVPTPPVAPARAAYRRASALAARIVEQLPVLPRAIEQFEELGGTAYGVRLWFGTSLDAGRAVLEVAAQADADVVKDPTPSGVFVETHAAIDGVPIIARALLSTADAAQLSGDPDPAPTSEDPTEALSAAEPVRLGASVIAVVPVVAAVAGGTE
ncbi:hypothetical protein [Streptomyces sp. LN245]|uniref:hypothetical protein n=1 Tax=Streptomyces sp. LN245 TaxID=3112975 RepID=UPI003721DAA1